MRERREGRTKRFYLPVEEQRAAACALDLTERELHALAVAAGAAEAVLEATPFREALRTATRKLREATRGAVLSFEPERQRFQWHFGSPSRSHPDPEVFERLIRAVRDCETLAIDYFAASSGRRSTGRLVDPYALALRGGTWLLVGRCHKADAALDFAVAAIERAEGTGRYFRRPADFDAELHFRDRFQAVAEDEAYVVRLEVAPEKAPHFRRKTYHPTQQIEEERPNGSLVVSYEVLGLKEIASFVRSWGAGVTALEPERLRRRLRKDLRAMQKAYA